MSLRFGPLDGRTWFVCVDMQRLFLEPGPWFCPAGLAILPACKTLSAVAPGRSLFTRFVPARRPTEAQGAWRRYYAHWTAVTLDAAGTDAIGLHADLAPFSAAGQVFDKTGYGAFGAPAFRDFITRQAPSALVIFGVETDVCVLATVLEAIDRGLRTIVPADAVASGDAAGHRAALDTLLPRFDQQIEITDSDTIVAELAGR